MPVTTQPEGSNRPSPAEELRQNLEETHRDLKRDARALTAKLQALPDPIPEDQLDAVAEYGRATRGLTQNIEAHRKIAKAPITAAGRAIDGFFASIGDPLTGIWAKVAERQTKALVAIADRNRAAEEEQRRREAEAAAEAKRIADERLARERERINPTDRPATERRSEGLAAVPPPEPPPVPSALAEAEREAQVATERAETAAAEHRRVIDAPSAEFARRRSDLGALSTLRERWVFTIDDRDQISKDALWPYISTESLEAAVRAAVAAGVREMAGVTIYKARKAEVR